MDMDITWFAAGTAFFIGSWGLVQFLSSLNVED